MAMFGYARVSPNGQELAGQVAELMAAGCAKVYREKASGAKTDRAELAKLLGKLEVGDVLIVTRLDRLTEIDTRSPQRARCGVQQGRRFPIPQGYVGRYDHPARAADVTVLGGLAEFE